MRRLLSNNLAVALSLTTLAAYFVGYAIWGADPPRIVFGSLLIGALCTVMYVLTGSALRAIGKGFIDGGDNILVSLWGVFSLLFFYFSWVQFSTWYRLHFGAEEAVALRELPVGGIFTTLFFLVTAYTILAPMNTSDEIEKPSLIRWFIGVFIGSAVAGVLGTLSFLGIIDYFAAIQ